MDKIERVPLDLSTKELDKEATNYIQLDIVDPFNVNLLKFTNK